MFGIDKIYISNNIKFTTTNIQIKFVIKKDILYFSGLKLLIFALSSKVDDDHEWCKSVNNIPTIKIVGISNKNADHNHNLSENDKAITGNKHIIIISSINIGFFIIYFKFNIRLFITINSLFIFVYA